MKNLQKAELAALSLTVLCLCFTVGYFTGRSSGAHIITVDTPNTTRAVAAVTAAAIKPSYVAEDKTFSAAELNIPGGETAAPLSDKLNINTASDAEFDALPGIGGILATRIVNYRDKIGRFTSIEQLKDIDGIGDKKFDAIKEMITVGS